MATSKPHPEDLVHRTTLRIPYPLLDEIDELHKQAMKDGTIPRAASRNEFIVHMIEATVRLMKTGKPPTKKR